MREIHNCSFLLGSFQWLLGSIWLTFKIIKMYYQFKWNFQEWLLALSPTNAEIFKWNNLCFLIEPKTRKNVPPSFNEDVHVTILANNEKFFSRRLFQPDLPDSYCKWVKIITYIKVKKHNSKVLEVHYPFNHVHGPIHN